MQKQLVTNCRHIDVKRHLCVQIFVEICNIHLLSFSYFRKLWPGYWQASADNNTFRVNKLVKSWCRINLARGPISLIEHAKSKSQDPKLIKHLVDNEASVELAHAVIAGDLHRVRYRLFS